MDEYIPHKQPTSGEEKIQQNGIAESMSKEAIKNIETSDPAAYLRELLITNPDIAPADFDEIILSDATSDEDRAFYIIVSDILCSQRMREVIRG